MVDFIKHLIMDEIKTFNNNVNGILWSEGKYDLIVETCLIPNVASITLRLVPSMGQEMSLWAVPIPINSVPMF